MHWIGLDWIGLDWSGCEVVSSDIRSLARWCSHTLTLTWHHRLLHLQPPLLPLPM